MHHATPEIYLHYACIAALTLLPLMQPPTVAQEDDQDSPYQPGLVATYNSAGQSATKIDQVLAFDLQDAACDPRLPPGDFSAHWRGRLWARGAGSYRLLCYCQGEVEIKLAGKTVVSGKTPQPQWLTSQPLDLDFDYHPLEVSFLKTSAIAQLALFWSGPDFRLEPIPARALMHDRAKSPSSTFERGQQLAAALRCAACHGDSTASVLPAPALDRLSGNMNQPWLVDWLSQHTPTRSVSEGSTLRRMPDLSMTHDEAEAVAAWLLREPPIPEQKAKEQKETKTTKSESKKSDAKAGKKGKADEKPKPSAAEGERLVLTRGCLACHKLGDLGDSGLFGGGDLTALPAKRPAEFLTRWLENPSAINRQHRMPTFTFTSDELASLALWAKQTHKPEAQALNQYQPEASARDKRPDPELVRQGEKLVTSFRCAACHDLSGETGKRLDPAQKVLSATSDWSRSCAGEPERAKMRPGYQLAGDDQSALKDYYSQPRPGEEKMPPQARGRDLLVQLNCLACHQREGVERFGLPALQDKLTAVAEAHSDLAPLIPAMTPPALNSVGDKLLDSALSDAISGQGPPHRPYLLVQMPKFDLTKDQLASLVAYFTATDRIPPVGNALRGVPATGDEPRPLVAALAAAGPRLVTTDGLACTSCHQVGSVLPSKAPLNARGPDMSMLGKRIRREWFDRWCDNPARIVPRMEMPAVKIPVRGVLNDKIDDQLAAVWHILNTPGFEPPEPNPVRVLRLSGIPERNERPIVIHDVVKDGDKTYLFPLVIGLPNRHNLLFDLETNRLAAWWLGDTARQRTKGKSWWWEQGAKSIFEGAESSDLSLIVDQTEYIPTSVGQFKEELKGLYLSETSKQHFFSELTLANAQSPKTIRLQVGEFFDSNPTRPIARLRSPLAGSFERTVTIRSAPPGSMLRLRLVPEHVARSGIWDTAKGMFLEKSGRYWIRVESVKEFKQWNGDGTATFSQTEPINPRSALNISATLTYGTDAPTDRYVREEVPARVAEIKNLEIAPGFEGRVLPFPADIMPSGITWMPNGRLAFCTLKGQVYTAIETNHDDLEDDLRLVADGLATPYGLSYGYGLTNLDTNHELLLVGAKTGLTLLQNPTPELHWATTQIVVTSGWGHTDDYHDWAVGPLLSKYETVGTAPQRRYCAEYYVALPCQQDQRTEAAANNRGTIMKVAAQTSEDGRNGNFNAEVISSGHRFPMGMARNREGELFVTDNQGNYNAFNELNHVRKGAHFGFINALEKQNGFKPPPLEEPAINIPHPWTRSVNGICFLDTPVGWVKDAQHPPTHAESAPPPRGSSPAAGSTHPTIYGPLEGHLIGCEYDTRRLIRMSLQKIGDTYQGCAYPLSIPPADVEKGLLGPIVCAIKPTTGELYVGEIRDSGWGAGNNIGQIVKIKIEPEKFPCGIAEVRATKTGFTIDFFQPVDRAKAADIASYSIFSYRRESTPAYGGPDLDRRDERISSAELSADAKRVTLTLPELRTGHVYEIRLKNLTPGGGLFHPDEAHYTLRQIP